MQGNNSYQANCTLWMLKNSVRLGSLLPQKSFHLEEFKFTAVLKQRREPFL